MSFEMVWQKIIELAVMFYNHAMTQGESNFMLVNPNFLNGNDVPDEAMFFFVGSFIVMVLLAIFACDSFNLFHPIKEIREWKSKISIIKVVIFTAAIFSFHTFYKMLVEITGVFLGADASIRALECLGSYINPIAIMVYAFAITTLPFRRQWFQAFMLGLAIFLTPSAMSFYGFTNEHIAIYAAAGSIAIAGGILYAFYMHNKCSPFVACFVLDLVYFIAKYFMIFYSDEVKLLSAQDHVGRIKQYLACVQMDFIFALILLLILFAYKIATIKNASVKKNIILPIILAALTIVSILCGTTELKYQPDYEKAIELWEEKKYDEAIKAFEVLYGYKDSQEYIEQCIQRLYHEALILMISEDYEGAIDKLLLISDYEDFAEIIAECEKNLLFKLTGTWQGAQGSVITLYEDGTCYYVDGSSGEGAGTWYVDNQDMIRIETDVLNYQLYALLSDGYDTETVLVKATGSGWIDEEFIKQ